MTSHWCSKDRPCSNPDAIRPFLEGRPDVVLCDVFAQCQWRAVGVDAALVDVHGARKTTTNNTPGNQSGMFDVMAVILRPSICQTLSVLPGRVSADDCYKHGNMDGGHGGRGARTEPAGGLSPSHTSLGRWPL